MADSLMARPQLISRLNVRRAMFALAFLCPAAGLAVMGFLTVNWYYCIAVMTLCEFTNFDQIYAVKGQAISNVLWRLEKILMY
jgi:hypothetical protein